MDKVPAFSPETPEGRNVHFGVREISMGAIGNGLLVHGGFIPYVATFLVFSDYARASLRVAALVKDGCYLGSIPRLYRCWRGRTPLISLSNSS